MESLLLAKSIKSSNSFRFKDLNTGGSSKYRGFKQSFIIDYASGLLINSLLITTES